MINHLLDEPVELNDKALNLLSNFDYWQEQFYVAYSLSIFKKENSEENLILLREKGSLVQDQMEKDFQIILEFEMKLILVDDLTYAVRLVPEFLLSYRTKRDLSDLVITSLSLECLRTAFNKVRTYNLRDGDEMVFGKIWHSLETAESEYTDCKNFMREYCPEAFKLHVKSITINQDLL